jgi:hypothetical protein
LKVIPIACFSDLLLYLENVGKYRTIEIPEFCSHSIRQLPCNTAIVGNYFGNYLRYVVDDRLRLIFDP